MPVQKSRAAHRELAREFLTPEQTADLLTIQTETLKKIRLAGGGPAFYRLSAHRVLYARADVDAWLADRRIAEAA